MSLDLGGILFVIKSKVRGNVVHIPGPKVQSVSSPINTKPKALPLQLFEVVPATGNDGYFFIENIGTKMVLDIYGGGSGEQQVLAWPNNNGNHQMWKAVPVSNDAPTTYIIVNKHTGTVLDVADNNEADGTSIISFPRHDGRNQQWEFVDVTTAILQAAS